GDSFRLAVDAGARLRDPELVFVHRRLSRRVRRRRAYRLDGLSAGADGYVTKPFYAPLSNGCPDGGGPLRERGWASGDDLATWRRDNAA
ncbi:hypothetical protein ACWCQQ_50805, partial [Streptomyces sp. NPDC002143]